MKIADLTSVLKKYPEAVEDTKRMTNLLKDLFPREQRDIWLLKQALEIDILRQIHTNQLDDSLARRLSMRLVNEFCLQQEKAEWAVNMWCEAYGVGVLKKPVLRTEKPVSPEAKPVLKQQINQQSTPIPQSTQQPGRPTAHVLDYINPFQMESNGHAPVKYVDSENIKIHVGDIIELKRQHHCGSNEWETLGEGADFRLKCLGCGQQIMIARRLIEKNVKGIRNPGWL